MLDQEPKKCYNQKGNCINCNYTDPKYSPCFCGLNNPKEKFKPDFFCGKKCENSSYEEFYKKNCKTCIIYYENHRYDYEEAMEEIWLENKLNQLKEY